MFLGVLGRKTSTFSSFFGVASHLREGVEVLGITPQLLNVSALGTRHLWRVPSSALFTVFSTRIFHLGLQASISVGKADKVIISLPASTLLV